MKKIKGTLLFTTKDCPKCPEAKQYMNDNNIEHNMITADESEANMNKAVTFGILQVPAIVEIYADLTHKLYNFAEYKDARAN